MWKARAFGTVGHACATKCKKCEKRRKAYVSRWKSSGMWARFRTAQNARIWSFLKTTMRCICFARCCCSLSYSSFSTRTSWRYGCIYTLCRHGCTGNSAHVQTVSSLFPRPPRAWVRGQSGGNTVFWRFSAAFLRRLTSHSPSQNASSYMDTQFYFCIYCDVDSKQASVLEVSGCLNVATSDQDRNIYKTGKGSQISGEMSSQFHYWEYNLHYPHAFGLSYTVCRGCT